MNTHNKVRKSPFKSLNEMKKGQVSTLLCVYFLREATDIVWRYNDIGKRVRVSLDSGKIIPKPPFERSDFKSKDAVPGKLCLK